MSSINYFYYDGNKPLKQNDIKGIGKNERRIMLWDGYTGGLC